jgi:hypothetical protein
MILKGSQRGGTRQLAAHLMNDRDNDHVTVYELRGFMAEDLYGAMAEAHAVAKGTRCRQPVFSLSLNPPKDADISADALADAAERAEKSLGLDGRPRAIIIHEKNGRRHAHVVWSRIDPEAMKATQLSFFKNRLSELSKELYLEHGWELPEGHRANGWKNPLNFSLAEWQQAKRLDLDPREIRQQFQEAWQQSDGLAAFKSALEERGYFLARGDRRGFVALDVHGEAYAVARLAGVKTKELEAKLGSPGKLPGVEEVRENIKARTKKRLREYLHEDRKEKQRKMQPLMDERRRLVKFQRGERERLALRQEERRVEETKQRAARFRRGLGAVFDFISGKTFKQRKENEREAYGCLLRDRAQRERLSVAQLEERKELQQRIDVLQAQHRQERMILARHVAELLRETPERTRGRDRRGPRNEFEMEP